MYDEIAQKEFGMDYEQLGSFEKEWCQDESDIQLEARQAARRKARR